MSPSPSLPGDAYLENGIIHQEYRGHVRAADVDKVAQSADSLIESQMEQEKPVLFLIDASGVTNSDATANLRIKHYLSTRYFNKVAFFGLPVHLHVVANLLAKATGRGANIHFFPNRDQAVSWLLEN